MLQQTHCISSGTPAIAWSTWSPHPSQVYLLQRRQMIREHMGFGQVSEVGRGPAGAAVRRVWVGRGLAQKGRPAGTTLAYCLGGQVWAAGRLRERRGEEDPLSYSRVRNGALVTSASHSCCIASRVPSARSESTACDTQEVKGEPLSSTRPNCSPPVPAGN